MVGAIALGLMMLAPAACTRQEVAARPPNIILILADDLGYGELGSYGQRHIRTPSLDRMAAEGIRFTQHYSGSPVCAPSRGTLLTGLHTGHAYIRDNDEMADRGDIWFDLSLEGQRPLLPDTVTIPGLLQRAGYVTGAMGKWGLGGPGSTGAPKQQGFDRWYGYLGQRLAHNYYPQHLWSDGVREMLDGNEYFHPHQPLPPEADPSDPVSYEPYSGQQYSMDRIVEEALSFVEQHQDRPFFLFLPFIVPHLALQVPQDSLDEYVGAFEETPYLGDQGYLPHPTPRAAYAAMITRMDREIGRIGARVAELGLDAGTLTIFTSDNGPSWVGGVDREFFTSSGPLRGRKAQLYEGGVRVPMIARWPGRIAAGGVSDQLSAFWDFMPTLAEVAGVAVPTESDGVSLLPTLLGRPEQQGRHEYLYWEFGGRQAVRLDDWKALRHRVGGPIELYDLAVDIGEIRDVAANEPSVVARIEQILRTARTESVLFPLVRTN